ncbi:hypothetical protein ACSFB8_07555 [Enterococcus faecalis]
MGIFDEKKEFEVFHRDKRLSPENQFSLNQYTYFKRLKIECEYHTKSVIDSDAFVTRVKNLTDELDHTQNVLLEEIQELLKKPASLADDTSN